MVLTFGKKYGVARFKCFDRQQTGKNAETSDKFGKKVLSPEFTRIRHVKGCALSYSTADHRGSKAGSAPSKFAPGFCPSARLAYCPSTTGIVSKRFCKSSSQFLSPIADTKFKTVALNTGMGKFRIFGRNQHSSRTRYEIGPLLL